jgi:UDP-glucose 4-epimerase
MLNDVINIGGALEFTIKEVAELIIKKTKSSSKIIHLPALKEGDMTRRMPDNTKMLNILQKDLTTLEKGIDLMLKHPDYIQ